ncbi:MAG: hypothetical protein ABI068_13505 [Ktedonobacterales bacterium]
MATQVSRSEQSSATTQATQATRTTASRLETLGILLLVGGYGYINGNFIQPTDTGFGVFIDIVHVIPLALMLWLGTALLWPSDEAGLAVARRRGLRVGITILAILGVVTSLVMIGLGVFVPSLGIGVQAFSDWLAVILVAGGAVLWFITPLLRRK